MGKYSQNNLIVDVAYYQNSIQSVKRSCNEYENLLSTYIGYLVEINQNGIASGKTAEALARLIHEISGIQGDMAAIGNDYEAIVQDFLTQINNADTIMYKNKNRKVLTDEEFNKAKSATRGIPELVSFVKLAWGLSGICKYYLIEGMIFLVSVLKKSVKQLNEQVAKDLNKTQKKVKSIDSTYQLALNNVYKELVNYNKVILTIAEVMSPDSKHFTSKNISRLTQCIKEAKRFKKYVDQNPFYMEITQKKSSKKGGGENKLEYTIPGLDQGFVPQGVTYDKEHDWIIISGYYKEGYPSQIMILDAKTGKVVKIITLRNRDGSLYTGHAGGVAYSNGHLYITGEGNVYTISGDELENAGKNDIITFSKQKKTSTAGSYANTSGENVYIGNFHQKGKNDVKSITVNGKQYSSYCEEYNSDVTKRQRIILTPDQTQGMTRTDDGRYIFSTSYGRDKKSIFYVYTGEPELIGYVDGVPVYQFTQKPTIIEGPPMSEGMCTIDGKNYVIYESGSKQYRDGTDGNGKSKNPTDKISILNLPEKLN